MADHKQEETFKVIDRRLFTEQGELRKDALEQERRDEEAAAKRSPASPQAKPAAPGVILGEHAGEAAPEGIAPSRNFQMMVDFLARNAVAMMGGMTNPRTGQPLVDLEGAREVIDMLDAVREKTRGNLAKADSDLVIEVIGNLKLSFMELSQAATEAMAKKAGAKK